MQLKTGEKDDAVDAAGRSATRARRRRARRRRSSTRSRSSTSCRRRRSPTARRRRPADAQMLPSGHEVHRRAPGHRQGEGAVLRHADVPLHRPGTATGRMFDSTEMKKKPMNVPPYRQSDGDGGGPDVDDRGRAPAILDAEREDAARRQAVAGDADRHALLRHRAAPDREGPRAAARAHRCRRAARGRAEDREGRDLQGPLAWQGRPASDADRQRARALHRLDDQRPDVRLVDREGRARHVLRSTG